MPSRTVIVCAQCGAVIEADPVGLGDELFCCLGCVGGGPCLCEQHDLISLSLRIGPFTAQPDLLRFAARLEQAPGLVQVELTRPDLDDARFSVVAASAAVLVLAVEANPDFAITVEATGNAVSARVAPPRRVRMTAPAGDLLPTRARFRVFRSASEPTTGDAAPTAPMAPPAESPEAEVADLLANARAAAAMHVRLPDPEPPARDRLRAAPPPPEPAVPVEPPIPAADAADATAAEPGEPEAPACQAVSMTVVGGPFPSFLAVNEFQGTLSALHGIRQMQVRRFYKGTLNLIVEYVDEVPLADRLRAAAGNAWIVHTATDDRVELRVTSDTAFAGAPRG